MNFCKEFQPFPIFVDLRPRSNAFEQNPYFKSNLIFLGLPKYMYFDSTVNLAQQVHTMNKFSSKSGKYWIPNPYFSSTISLWAHTITWLFVKSVLTFLGQFVLKLATFATNFSHYAVQKLESNAHCTILKFLGFIIMAWFICSI